MVLIPRISVRRVNRHPVLRGRNACGLVIGTPATIKPGVAHMLAMLLEPFDSRMSLMTRTVERHPDPEAPGLRFVLPSAVADFAAFPGSVDSPTEKEGKLWSSMNFGIFFKQSIDPLLIA